jgi:hypothetical protein
MNKNIFLEGLWSLPLRRQGVPSAGSGRRATLLATTGRILPLRAGCEAIFTK